MILIWLLLIPMIGGVLAWLLGRANANAARWVSIVALAANLVLGLLIWTGQMGPTRGPWLAEIMLPWVPQFGIGFHLAMDGLSLTFVLLTSFLGIMAVVSSWNEVHRRVGFFHFNLMWAVTGIAGVFLAMDLFLFYFFWEVMLIPTYFLFLWGYERRLYAAIKFFLFTQLSGLLMLLSILGLFFFNGQASRNFTFDYVQLLGTQIPEPVATYLMLGFFIAFAVKLGTVPFHTWLPDAYTEAPTAGTVILAALMAKTAGYGLIRFVFPLFPESAAQFAPIAMGLGVAGILYGALLAFGQRDLKRLVAYSSLAHMGFVMVGVFAWTELSVQGSVMEMVAHGVSTGALFMLVGALQERMRTRDMNRMGGLWATIPRMGGTTLLFALAALGLPGLGNFVGEFLILVGSYRVNPTLTVLATLGVVFATVYALWMIQRTFQGPNTEGWRLPDLNLRESAAMAVLVVAILWLGLFPQPVLNATSQALNNLQQLAPKRTEAPATQFLVTRDRSEEAAVVPGGNR